MSGEYSGSKAKPEEMLTNKLGIPQQASNDIPDQPDTAEPAEKDPIRLEVEVLKKEPENWYKSSESLQEFVLARRMDEVSGFCSIPGVEKNIIQSYQRENLKTPLYTDPTLTEDERLVAKNIVENIRQNSTIYIDKLNALLPPGYSQLEAFPAVFLHSLETAQKMFNNPRLTGGGNTFRSDKKYINLFIDPAEEEYYLQILIHEAVHCCENESTSSFGKRDMSGGGLYEGVARMVEEQCFGVDSSEELVLVLKEMYHNSRHPLANAINLDKNSNIQISPIRLSITDFTSTSREDEVMAHAGAVAFYQMYASFLSWFRQSQTKSGHDPVGILVEGPDKHPNYQLILQKMQESFQTERLNGRKRYMSRDMELLGNTNLYRLVMPDDDPVLLDLVEKVSNMKFPGQSYELDILLANFCLEITQRFGPIEKDYGEFLTEILHRQE